MKLGESGRQTTWQIPEAKKALDTEPPILVPADLMDFNHHSSYTLMLSDFFCFALP